MSQFRFTRNNSWIPFTCGIKELLGKEEVQPSCKTVELAQLGV
jgi:hypothetical protein